MFWGKREKSQRENSLSYAQNHCSQQEKNNCFFPGFWWLAICADPSTVVQIQNCTFNMASLCYCWFPKARSNYRNYQILESSKLQLDVEVLPIRHDILKLPCSWHSLNIGLVLVCSTRKIQETSSITKQGSVFKETSPRRMRCCAFTSTFCYCGLRYEGAILHALLFIHIVYDLN